MTQRSLAGLLAVAIVAFAACGDNGAQITGPTVDTLKLDAATAFPDAADTGGVEDTAGPVDTLEEDTADPVDTLEEDTTSSDDVEVIEDTGAAPTVDWCRLQWPLDVTIGAATELTVYGHVTVAGLTDLTAGNDTDESLVGRVGFGAANSDPSTWTDWMAASANPGYTAEADEADQDEYYATLPAFGATGSYDFAFAFSLDSGATWVYCDRDAGDGSNGSEDGYQVDNAGKLVVVPNPCATNPCTEPPDACVGTDLSTYANPGVCSDDGGQPFCDYGDATTEDCAATGKVCDPTTLSCVEDGCTPNPCTSGRDDACDGNELVVYETMGSCDDSTGTVECVYGEASRTDCATTADPFCIRGACRPWRLAGVDDLVITEVMPSPDAVPDARGEWFEVMSVASDPVNLWGLVVSDDGTDSFTVGLDVIVDPGAYAIFGRDGDAAANGGVTVDYVYEGMFLAGSADELRLSRDGSEIDSVAWDSEWTITDGASLSVDPGLEDDNHLRDSWCDATTAYGDGDLGTPGAPNTPCAYTINWCRLNAPAPTTTAYVGTPFDVFGQVYVPGLTDQNVSANPSPLLVAEVGWGDTNTTADTWTSWFPAAPNEAFDASSTPNDDEYFGALTPPTVPSPPVYDFAVRFSGDGGQTWTYCDTDGGDYTTDMAGKMTVVSDLCGGVVCDAPPAPTCNGQNEVVTYAATGSCDPVSGSCVYAETTTSCGDQLCAEGACADWRLAAAGDLKITEIMANPDGDDTTGEWFEVFNASSDRLNLIGLRIIDNGSTGLDIDTNLTVDAGDYLVFGANADAAVNGGVVVDVEMPFALSNSGDEITIRRGDEILEQVNYDQDGPGTPLDLPVVSGHSLQVKPAGDNQVADDWCLGHTAMIDPTGTREQFGTPGAANVDCLTVDWCRLQSPASAGVNVGGSIEVWGRWYGAGVTDQNQTGNDPHDLVWASFGISPDSNTSVDVTEWTAWTNAALNGGYNTTSPSFYQDHDEWTATLTAPTTTGSFYYAFRVSVDRGRSWTYCDLDQRDAGGADGSADGFSVADAGQLAVCDCEIQRSCNGDVLTVSSPTCTIEGNTPQCAYDQATEFDCSQDGDRCDPTLTACVGCLEDSDCAGPFEVCDVDSTSQCVAGCQDDALEPNDTNEPYMLSGDFNQAGLVLCDNDSDAYRITAAAGKQLEILVEFVHADGDLAVDLRTGGSSVAAADTQDDDETLTYTVPAGAGGTYDVVVTGVGGAHNVYELTVLVSDSAPAWSRPDTAGDLVITEIMSDPALGPQYVEVYNATDHQLNLDGVVVETSTNPSFTVDGETLVASGAYAVFGWGFGDVDVTSLTLAAQDLLILKANDDTTVLDELSWDATWPLVQGAALSLDPAALDQAAPHTANDASANWCVATSLTADGDRGTPGAANDAPCVRPVTIGWCRLQDPHSLDVAVDSANPVFGRVYVEGVTDQNENGNDPHPAIVGAVGYGPTGTDPAMDNNWAWFQGAPNPAYVVTGNPAPEPNNDEYVADLVPAAAGVFDFAFRFSGDGGLTWTNCDIDGVTADGNQTYSADQAGDLNVTGAAGTLFISEYVEGGGQNKAVELYNASGVDIDLGAQGCEIWNYNSDADNHSSAHTATALTGTIAADGVYLACNDQAPFADNCQLRHSNLAWNGDDVVELRCGDASVDFVGQKGHGKDNFAKDVTLRRKCAIIAGNTDGEAAFDPTVEWDSSPSDTVDGLGSHTVCN